MKLATVAVETEPVTHRDLVCPYDKLFQTSRRKPGPGTRGLASEGCTDSPKLLLSSWPQFLAHLFSVESFNLSDVDIFPYTKGSGLQRAQLPGWCPRGTMAIVRRHIQGLSTGEWPRVLGSLRMASDAVWSISSLPFSYCWKLPRNWKEPLSG